MKLRSFHSFFSDENAATAIEYAIVAAGIAAALVAVINNLGVSVGGMYNSLTLALK